MKHIKEYSSFGSISTNDILQDLKDMCLELVDNGFEVEVTEYQILLSSTKQDKRFKFGEVREYLSRVVEYLTELDIISNVRIFKHQSGWIPFNTLKKPDTWVLVNGESDKEDETLIVAANVFYDLFTPPVVTHQHIKEYSLYESENISNMDTIKDICIELEHDGFSFAIEEHDKSENYLLDIGQGLNGWYSLVIQKRESGSPGNNMWRSIEFKVNEVSVVVWRLVDYLDKGVLSIHLLTSLDGRYAWRIFPLDKVMDSSIKCKGIEIKFEL